MFHYAYDSWIEENRGKTTDYLWDYDFVFDWCGVRRKSLRNNFNDSELERNDLNESELGRNDLNESKLTRNDINQSELERKSRSQRYISLFCASAYSRASLYFNPCS